MSTNCGMYAPRLYRLGAKSRAESAGNSSKAYCSSILFRTLTPSLTLGVTSHSLGPIIEYYRSIVKQKTLYKPFFCVWGVQGKVLSRQGLTAIRANQKGQKKKIPEAQVKNLICIMLFMAVMLHGSLDGNLIY